MKHTEMPQKTLLQKYFPGWICGTKMHMCVQRAIWFPVHTPKIELGATSKETLLCLQGGTVILKEASQLHICFPQPDCVSYCL